MENNRKEEKKTTNANERVLCEICGTVYNKRNKARHLKSRKCRQVRYVWVERFEITR